MSQSTTDQSTTDQSTTPVVHGRYTDLRSDVNYVKNVKSVNVKTFNRDGFILFPRAEDCTVVVYYTPHSGALDDVAREAGFV